MSILSAPKFFWSDVYELDYSFVQSLVLFKINQLINLICFGFKPHLLFGLLFGICFCFFAFFEFAIRFASSQI
jgi:hypothetical protein